MDEEIDRLKLFFIYLSKNYKAKARLYVDDSEHKWEERTLTKGEEVRILVPVESVQCSQLIHSAVEYNSYTKTNSTIA